MIGGVTIGVLSNAIYSWSAKTWHTFKLRMRGIGLVPIKAGVFYCPQTKAFCCPKCSTKEFPVPMISNTQMADDVKITWVECVRCGLNAGIKNFS